MQAALKLEFNFYRRGSYLLYMLCTMLYKSLKKNICEEKPLHGKTKQKHLKKQIEVDRNASFTELIFCV